jgi:hypothetical protein
VLGLAGDVLPQLEVEVNVAHLDTLERLPIVLEKNCRQNIKKCFSYKKWSNLDPNCLSKIDKNGFEFSLFKCDLARTTGRNLDRVFNSRSGCM